MRAKRPTAPAPASAECRRCTAVVLRGSARCTLCGWPVGVTYPPLEAEGLATDGAAEEVPAEPPATDAGPDLAAQDAQLDALAVIVARRAPAPVEPEVVAAELVAVTGDGAEGSDDAAASNAVGTTDKVADRVVDRVADRDVALGGEATDDQQDQVEATATTLVAVASPTVAEGSGSHRGPRSDLRQPAATGPVGDDRSSEELATRRPAHAAGGQDPTTEQALPPATSSAARAAGLMPGASGPLGAMGRRAVLSVLAVPSVWALSVLFGIFTVSMFEQGFHAELSGRDASSTLGMTGLLLLATSLLSLLTLAATVVAAVFFLLWVSRARARVGQLSSVRQRWSPTWSVVGWLIPLFNIYLGWQVLEDLWRGSDPASRAAASPAPAATTSTAPVHAWLASAVAIVVVVVVTGVLVGGSLLGELLRLVTVALSAWCLCRVVSRISSWQDDARLG